MDQKNNTLIAVMLLELRSISGGTGTFFSASELFDRLGGRDSADRKQMSQRLNLLKTMGVVDRWRTKNQYRTNPSAIDRELIKRGLI